MSSDKQEVFDRLEAALRPKLEELRQVTSRKQKLVKDISELVDVSHVMDPRWISSFLKWLFEKEQIDVSDRTIEYACGPLQKQKTKPKVEGERNIAQIDDNKVLSHSNDGITHVEDPNDVNRKEREEMADEFGKGVVPVPREINESEIEARDQKIAILNDTIKTMQKQIDSLEKENADLERIGLEERTKAKATKEDFDKLKVRTDELEEALAKSIKKEGFTTASSIPTKMPQANEQLWIPAIEALHLFVPLRKARDVAVDNHQPWRKVLFEWEANSGRITGARLADA